MFGLVPVALFRLLLVVALVVLNLLGFVVVVLLLPSKLCNVALP